MTVAAAGRHSTKPPSQLLSRRAEPVGGWRDTRVRSTSNSPCPRLTVAKKWNLTARGSSKTLRHGVFGNFSKSGSDDTWWIKDNAGHGGSAFKVYREQAKGLQWLRDADERGDFITGKHKGETGKFIPWSQLN
jgi:hypothetical protein